MSDDIFQKARDRITPGLIESLFSSSGSRWTAGQFFCLSPLRADKHVGSFRINKDGLYFDSATDEGGDLIELLSKARGITLKEAAEIIAGEKADSGYERKQDPGSKKKRNTSTKKKYYGFKYPTDAQVDEIRYKVKDQYWINKYGALKAGYKYEDETGVRFVVAKYVNESGEKNFVPFYLCAKKKRWVSGLPEAIRIPYNYRQIIDNPELPVLIVEGEKCAGVDVPGWVLTTWAGGALSYKKTDFSILHGRRVVIWPDNDEPGLQAAEALRYDLNAQVIDPVALGLPEKQDIYDANKSGFMIQDILDNGPFIEPEQSDIPEYIDPETGEFKNSEEIPEKAIKEFGGNPPPKKTTESEIDPSNVFRFLGYTDTAHYFMLTRERIIVSIARGGFTSSRVLMLAPLSWWDQAAMVTAQGAIKLTFAQDFLQAESSRAGRFDDAKIRGTGVWQDGDEFILNTGENLVTSDGRVMEYDEFKTRYFYVSSNVSFGPLGDRESTDEEGQSLHELFKAHAWSGEIDHRIALGWALLAPMAGALQWRPHLWITGRFGSGKSYFIENLLNPIVGTFRHSGSAGDTESGIRRSIQNDPRPVILDEMKVKSQKDDEKIRAILSLARDASSNASATRTMAGRDGGTEQFTIRSPFCFGSDQPPAMDGAIESRIIKVEAFSPPKDRQATFQAQRKEETLKHIAAIRNPERYRLRIFRRLPEIMQDVEWLRDKLLEILGGQRAADNYAPILAFEWHIRNSFSMRSGAMGAAYVEELRKHFQADTPVETENDEDALIYTILAQKIRISYDETITIAECLTRVSSQYRDELSRIGIKVQGPELLIATKSDAINEMLRGTPFHGNYNAQLIRHEYCLNRDGSGKLVRFKIGQKRARVFDYQKFIANYVGAGDDE